MRCVSALLRTLALSSLLLGCSDLFISTLRVSIADYDLLGSQRVDRAHFDFTYRAHCVNDGPPADAVVAVLQSRSPATTVIEGTLRCGPVGTRASVPSLDTFTIRQDRRTPFDPSALVWIVATIGKAESRETDDGPTRIQRAYRVSVTNRTADPDVARVLLSSARSTVVVTDDRADVILKPGITTLTSDLVEVVYERGALFDAAALSLTLQLGLGNTEAVALVQTLDGVGHPLTGVQIDELGPSGPRTFAGDAESGVATLGQGGGELLWKFSKPGFLSVWRKQTVSAGKVTLVPSPRLAQRVPEGAPLSPLNDALVSDPGNRLRIAFAAGTFPDGGEAKLTPLDGQSLPAFLPAGWSPLTAFWLELPSAPVGPAGAEIDLDDGLAASDHAALVRFDPDTIQWQVLETLHGDGAARVAATIPGAGAYAVVVADIGAGAPATPVAFQPLPAGTAALPDPSTLQAEGSVTPALSPASPIAQEVTGVADVRLTSPSPIPSGFVLEAVLADSYTMADGRTLSLPGYSSFLVAYRRPGTGDEKHASLRFPLRPRLLFAGDVLTEAHVRAQVRAVSDFTGGVLSARGGTLSAAGIEVLASAGDLEGTRPARLDALDANGFAALLPTGTQAALAFELAVDGVSDGRSLRASFAPQTPNAFFVLARTVSGGGRSGLEPVERLRSDGAGILASIEPTPATDRLSGLVRGGQYVLLRLAAPQGLITGTARSGGAGPTPLGVSVSGQPWLTLPGVADTYRLLAPAGAVQAVARELASGDEGRGTGALIDDTSVLRLDLVTGPTGPRVASIDPADAARDVPAVTPITVRFSEPLAPGSFGPEGLVLRDANGARVEGSLSLDLSRTNATFLPTNPLATRTTHTIEIAAGIQDLQGLALEGERTFDFTTASPAARGAGAELVVYEPGAQTSACDDVPGIDRSSKGFVCMTGTQGTADPDAPVVLVNDSTGTTSTVRSKLDGSFQGFIVAAEEDLVSATFVNANRTQIRIPASRQLFDDGSVGLYNAGGVLEAQDANGTVQVIVEAGSIPTRTKFKLETATVPELLESAKGNPPEEGKLLAGLKLTVSGDPLKQSVDVSIPVDPTSLPIPEGTRPEDGAYALGVVREVDGVVGYQIVDRLKYEDGKLVTHSFPFLGLLAFVGEFAVQEAAELVATAIVLGEDPIPTRGIVGTCTPLPSGFCPGESGLGAIVVGDAFLKPLPGALVSATRVGSGGADPFTGRPGGIRAGEAFAVTDTEGRYALNLPLRKRSFGIGQDVSFVLTASHPRFRVVASEPLTFTDFNLFNPLVPRTAEKNIPFRVGTVGEANPANRRPVLSVGHSPERPAPGQLGSLRVFASHPKQLPTVSVSILQVASLVPGVTVLPTDIQVTLASEETPGGTSRRQKYDIQSSKAAFARFRIEAKVEGLQPAVATYAINFTGDALAPANPITNPDPNDLSGPRVVRALPSGGGGLLPEEPLVILFNEPVDKAILEDPAAITLSGPNVGDAEQPSRALSPDQRELTLRFPRLLPGRDYTLTIGTSVRDLPKQNLTPGNALDQDPGTPNAPDAYVLTFESAPVRTGSIPIESGGGALVRGRYAYVLERAGASDGALVVFDLARPDSPVRKAEVSVPGFPRDLAFIGPYDFKRTTDGPVETATLIAVVGGKAGGSFDEAGNLLSGGQYLHIIDVTDPEHPSRLLGRQISRSPSSVVNRVIWKPPHLAYLELGADLKQIGVVNLQTLILGFFSSREQFQQFPLFGTKGQDTNGDGDFVDDGEALPLPPKEPVDFAGKVDAFVLSDTTQPLVDFQYEPGRRYCGVVLDGGKLIAPNGMPTATDVAPAYRTLASGALSLPRASASFEFSGRRVKRLLTLIGVEVKLGADLVILDLALVSLAPLQPGASSLAVLDITNPNRPKLLNEIELPEAAGIVQSVDLKEGGILRLATANDILFLDLSRITEPAPPAGQAPAFLGTIAGAGAGSRSTDGDLAGVNVIAFGGRNEVVQAAPKFEFMGYTEEGAIVDPSTVSGEPTRDAIAAKLGRLAPVSVVFGARVKSSSGATSSLSPPLAADHYHVLVRAPGGDPTGGRTIDLTLESLNAAGIPLKSRGPRFAPTRAASLDALQAIGESPRNKLDAPTRALKAWRVSDDPRDPELYNLYLSRPFAIVHETLTVKELARLKSELDRDVLWAGHTLRVSIDFSEKADPAIGPFATLPDGTGKQFKPRAAAFALTLPGDAISGPNPRPLIGGQRAPGTLGAVDALNGQVELEATDLSLPGRRSPLQFTRFVSGQDTYEGPFGRGWDFTFNQRLVALEPRLFPEGRRFPVVEGGPGAGQVANARDIVFHDGQGRSILYRFTGTSPPPEVIDDPLVKSLRWTIDAKAFYLPPPGVFDPLFRFGDGRFARLTPNGTQYWYSGDGQLESVQERFDKNRTTLHYDERGELVRIQSEASPGLFFELGYYRTNDDDFVRNAIDGSALDEPGAPAEVAGKIARLRDSTGRDVRYYYDRSGLLLERVENADVHTISPGGETGRQVVRYVSDIDDSSTSGGNGAAGLVAGAGTGTPLVAASFNGASDGVASSVTGANGGVGVSLGNPNTADAVAAGGATSTVKTPDAADTKYSFGKQGLPEHIDYSGYLDAPHGVDIHYNADSLVQKITYPEGNTVTYGYPGASAPLRSRANVVSTAGDPGPRPGTKLTSTAVFDERFNLPSGVQTDFNGTSVTITLQPDAKEVASIQHGTAGTETFSYNEYGQLESATSLDGITSGSKYLHPDGFVTETSEGSLITTYDYAGAAGPRGNPTTITLPNPAGQVQNTWDERDRLVSSVRGAWSEQRGLDQQGRVKKLVRTLGNGANFVEHHTYDQVGFELSSAIENVDVGGQATTLSTSYIPDAMHRPSQIIHPGGRTQIFTYDHMGRVRGMSFGGYTEGLTYDGNGNVLTREIGGAKWSYVYDGHDRLVESDSPEGERTLQDFYGRGELASESHLDTDGKVSSGRTIQIDDSGRPTHVDFAKDGGSAPLDIHYDSGAHTTELVNSEGHKTKQFYDDAGRIFREQTAVRDMTATLDGNGRADPVQFDEGRSFVLRQGHDQFGHTLGESDGIGPIATYVPRLDGAVTEIKDAKGRATRQKLTVLGEQTSWEPPHGVDRTFQYDDERALSSVQDVAGAGMSWLFDTTRRLASITDRAGGITSFGGFDGRRQPATANIPGGTMTLSHDLQGRTTSREVKFGTTERDEAYTWDALQRIKTATYQDGSVHLAYDALGPLRVASFAEHGATYDVKHGIRGDGARVSLTYPSGVQLTEGRDLGGRLETVLPSGEDPVVQSTTFVAADLVGSRTLGAGLIRFEADYDARRRPLFFRYVRIADSRTLVDVRYEYDAVDDVVGRQYVHRGGRADLFSYDAGHRLAAHQADARPGIGGEIPRSPSGFTVPPGVSVPFVAGPYGRARSYDPGGLDLPVASTVLHSIPGFAPPPFAASYAAPDSQLQLAEIDGFQRGTSDAMGSTQRTELLVKKLGSSGATKVPASLEHDGTGQLLRVERSDGAKIENTYRFNGLRHHRKVDCAAANGCISSDRGYAYGEDGELLEETELGSGGGLVGRYYYAGSDVPVAAMLRAGPGSPRRFYYLTDASGSVLALVDAQGNVVERTIYDAFGYPRMEAQDTASPHVARILSTGQGLQIEMSEPVLPPLAVGGGSGLVGAYAPLAGAIALRSGAQPIAGTVRYEEGAIGFVPGTVLRFEPSVLPLPADLTLVLPADGLVDEWGNGNSAEQIPFTFAATPGTELKRAVASGSSAPALLQRSSVGSPFGFHGQYVDDETGLVYMRARFYDPYTGLFLERDPEAYGDSVDNYSAFGHNPISHRDPTGRGFFSTLGRLLLEGAAAGGSGIAERGLARLLEREALERAATKAASGALFDAEGTQVLQRAVGRVRRGLDPRQAAREVGERQYNEAAATLEREGTRLADDVIADVLDPAVARNTSEQVTRIRDLASWRGLENRVVTPGEFDFWARNVATENNLERGALKVLSLKNAGRQLEFEGQSVLFLHNELIATARAGRAVGGGLAEAEQSASETVLAEYTHEIGDFTLREIGRTNPWIRTTYAEGEEFAKRLQLPFENAFIRRIATADRALAERLAPSLRGGRSALPPRSAP